jgi:hypothetical protein
VIVLDGLDAVKVDGGGYVFRAPADHAHQLVEATRSGGVEHALEQRCRSERQQLLGLPEAV